MTVSALQISRAIRDPSYAPPDPGSPPPPYLTKPTNVARAAVRTYHRTGATAATNYLASSLGSWLNHRNPSMASNARNTLNGLGNYISADRADGRKIRMLDAKTTVSLPSGEVAVRFDVVLNDGPSVAARVVLWDGPDFADADAPAIGAVYAQALTAMYPTSTATTIGIWQARRGHFAEVAAAVAVREIPRVTELRSRI